MLLNMPVPRQAQTEGSFQTGYREEGGEHDMLVCKQDSRSTRRALKQNTSLGRPFLLRSVHDGSTSVQEGEQGFGCSDGNRYTSSSGVSPGDKSSLAELYALLGCQNIAVEESVTRCKDDKASATTPRRSVRACRRRAKQKAILAKEDNPADDRDKVAADYENEKQHISEGSEDARQTSGHSHSSDQEHKKRRRKEINRLSAQRIRERKLMETEQLKQEVVTLKARNEGLVRTAAQLVREKTNLLQRTVHLTERWEHVVADNIALRERLQAVTPSASVPLCDWSSALPQEAPVLCTSPPVMPFPSMGIARTPMRQSSGEEQALASASEALELQWPGSFPWSLQAKNPDDLDVLDQA